ncbi:MAG: hypothetical protein J3K34DRAFT_460714 [Monoraphidium minutum]|nr:MAG: hypothetical protein J3K34DRAFT_460714 [Monoraphidium minutum]
MSTQDDAAALPASGGGLPAEVSGGPHAPPPSVEVDAAAAGAVAAEVEQSAGESFLSAASAAAASAEALGALGAPTEALGAEGSDVGAPGAAADAPAAAPDAPPVGQGEADAAAGPLVSTGPKLAPVRTRVGQQAPQQQQQTAAGAPPAPQLPVGASPRPAPAPGPAGGGAAAPGATLTAADFDGEVCSPMCRRAAAAAGWSRAAGGDAGGGRLTCVLVHGCCGLLAGDDPSVVAPVVRLHVVSAATGEYLRLAAPPGDAGAADAAAAALGEGGEGGEGGGGGPRSAAASGRLLLEPEAQAQVLEYPGRPALATFANNTGAPAPALLPYLPPLQTLPCDLVNPARSPRRGGAPPGGAAAAPGSPLRASAGGALGPCGGGGGGGSGGAAAWEEELALDVDPEALASEDALLLAEVLQLPTSFRGYAAAPRGHYGGGGGGGARGVAWGFLRLRGLGVGGLGGGGRRLKLQLYRYHTPGSLAPPAPYPDTPARAAYVSWRCTVGNAPAAAAAAAAAGAAGGAGGGAPLAAAVLAGKGAADKYPCVLEVTLSARPRPAAAVVVTDPAGGVRPVLPAGGGGGFEIGGAAPPLYGALPAAQRAGRARARGTAGGCGCVAFSRDGRWLAAACANSEGATKVAIYHGLTGQLQCVLGGHDGLVYSVTWSPDDSALVTASGDLTAKVWHLRPPLGITGGGSGGGGGPGGGGGVFGTGGLYGSVGSVGSGALGALLASSPRRHGGGGGSLASTGALRTSVGGREEAAAQAQPGSPHGFTARSGGGGGGEGAEGGGAARWDDGGCGVGVATLQHACFVYTAEFCPMAGLGSCVVATGGYDGALRLWDAARGLLLCCVQLSLSARLNTLAFDSLGARLYVGDSDGMVHELALDLRGSCQEPLKKLRASADLAGRPICHLLPHPGGRHLLALTRSGDLVALDLKLLISIRRFGGVKAGPGPLKAAVSPDGQFLLCGSGDGAVWCWPFEGGGGARLPHLELGGAAVAALDWSRSFHAVAACSPSAYAPICITCFDARLPPARLELRDAAAAAPPGTRRGAHAQGEPHWQQQAAAARRRGALPERLTPDDVHALLRELRAGAARRGLYKGAGDPDGEHLVVPAESAAAGCSGEQGCGGDGGARAPGGANRRRYGGGSAAGRRAGALEARAGGAAAANAKSPAARRPAEEGGVGAEAKAPWEVEAAGRAAVA